MSSWLLVTAQFVLLYLIASETPLRSLPAWITFLCLAAATFAGWAVITMRRSLNVFPELRQGATLLTNGPYRFVRHPMYFALLVISAALVIHEPSWLKSASMLGLGVVFYLKAKREERFLNQRFSEYKNYCQKVAPLIPGLRW